MLFSRASTTCQLSSYCESFLGCLMRLPPSVQVPSRTPLNSRITNANLLLHPLLIRLCHNVSAAIAGASAYSFRSHRPKGLAIYSREQAARTGFQSCFLRPMSVSPYINGIVIVQRNSAFHFGCLLQLHIQFSPGLRPRSRNCASRHSDDTCTSFMQCC